MTAASGRTALKIAFTFAGTLIGAGFASGQELLQFFITYGNLGLVGIGFAGLLFAGLSWRLLAVSHCLQLHTYPELIYYLCGKKFGRCFDGAIFFFLFAVLVVMLAGAGSLTEDLFALPARCGQLILSACIIAAASKGVQRIAKINLYVTPFLAAVIVLVSASSLHYHAFSWEFFRVAALPVAPPAPHWLLSCLLYVAYNLTLSAAVLIPLGRVTADRSARLYGSLLGGITLAALSFLIVGTLLLHTPDILAAPLPMLTISCSQNPLHALLYAAVFILAIFTSSLACLYGCAAKLSTILPISYPLCLILAIFAALCFSQIGFSRLIGIIFPIFGYPALWLCIRLLFKKTPERRLPHDKL